MSDEKRTWYQRTHQFTPYTKADGTAVSDEFDAIQASFERIPAMRDDGKGFATSPLIPEPSDPDHPVPFKMLTETEASVNNARDDVIKKAQQVASAAQEVAKNTQITATNTQTAQQAATSALSSSQSADESENMARKWASNPENEVVLDEKYSAYHYAQKAAQLAVNLASAESSATQSATIATQKAEEATQAAKKAESLAVGEVDYAKVLNVPRSNINTEGVVRLTNDTGLESESLALTAKAGKKLAQLIATVQLALNNYIPLNKRSSAVNSNDENNVATSKAVKTAYDKGVEAEELANTKWTAKSATETEPGILPISHKTDGADKNKFASEYAVGEAAKKGLPLGAVVSFPRAVTNPNGFLRANGSTFNASAFPDLYKVLGNSNTLPDLTRSDVGMTAYFAVDNIPAGWIAFDEIATQVTEQRYPELYRHLIDKYGSINSVPKVADRFLRNAGNGLSVGQIQEDDLKRHVHRVPIDYDSWFDDSSQGRNNSYFDYTTFAQSSDLWSTLGYDNADGDNGFVSPKDTSQMATGGDETRPKSLVLKLCIKALNSFDDVVFWIKSHGEVTNAGTLDAGRLAQDIQQLSAKTQQIERQSNQNEKLSLELKNQLSQIKNKEPTSRKIWQGNVTNGSGVLTLSESIINKNLVFYLQPSRGHTLSNNDVNTVSCYIDSTLPDVRRTRFAFTAYWDGGLRNFKIEIVSEKQIKLIDASSFYLKMITASD
ncbi:phage tail fiber repeat protein [Haemophilus influenzae]|uniref:tail fiber protein n=6 Tax=Haemophilus influenzae TaxID=727 RepID=UPI000B059184|nr:phage tail fiber repeat protein [Haemophilus influenzae]PRJ90940.1 phage tail fiber repeat protein [Haemophilus influenzae]PRJ92748.1 phage tail fiber repeat protein [Haemophilus influenzae]PRK27088.1 phage tail fiber repeat protein [Haemophilus influenzae]PRL95172.1 phage tail fiber repeat protein [Haemophilus influenzae]